MLARVVRFKLTGIHAAWAEAFEAHCANELNIKKDLSDLVKAQFLRFLQDNMLPPAGGSDVAPVGVPAGDPAAAQD